MTFFVFIVLALILLTITGIVLLSMNEKLFYAEAATNIQYDENRNILTFDCYGEHFKFYGSCTVWHNENGRRCDTFEESELSDIWTKYKIENGKRV